MSPARAEVLEGRRILERQKISVGNNIDTSLEGIGIGVRPLQKSTEVAFGGKGVYAELRGKKVPQHAILKAEIDQGNVVVNLTEEVDTVEVKKIGSKKSVRIKHIP